MVAGQLTHSGLNQARAPNTFCSSELSDLLCFQYFILQNLIVFLKKKKKSYIGYFFVGMLLMRLQLSRNR